MLERSNQKKTTSIVIRNFFPHDRRVIVMNERLGKVEASAHVQVAIDRLCHGAIFTSLLSGVGQRYRIAEIDILHVPFELARQHLAFFHQLFELCYHLIPMGGGCEGIFELLFFLFSPNAAWTYDESFHKIILLRFFAILGLIPENVRLKSLQFYRLTSAPLEGILDQTHGVDLELDSWLLACVSAHPKVRLFRSNNVLKQCGTI